MDGNFTRNTVLRRKCSTEVSAAPPPPPQVSLNRRSTLEISAETQGGLNSDHAAASANSASLR